MLCDYFPTVDPADPYRLTEEERLVVERPYDWLLEFGKTAEARPPLFSKGSMYLSYNDNLLFHGCAAESGRQLYGDGDHQCQIQRQALLDKYEEVLRRGYLNREGKKHNVRILDLIWYLWEGKASSCSARIR